MSMASHCTFNFPCALLRGRACEIVIGLHACDSIANNLAEQTAFCIFRMAAAWCEYWLPEVSYRRASPPKTASRVIPTLWRNHINSVNLWQPSSIIMYAKLPHRVRTHSKRTCRVQGICITCVRVTPGTHSLPHSTCPQSAEYDGAVVSMRSWY